MDVSKNKCEILWFFAADKWVSSSAYGLVARETVSARLAELVGIANRREMLSIESMHIIPPSPTGSPFYFVLPVCLFGRSSKRYFCLTRWGQRQLNLINNNHSRLLSLPAYRRETFHFCPRSPNDCRVTACIRSNLFPLMTSTMIRGGWWCHRRLPRSC